MAANGVGSTPGAPAMDSTSGSSDDVIIIVEYIAMKDKRGGKRNEISRISTRPRDPLFRHDKSRTQFPRRVSDD